MLSRRDLLKSTGGALIAAPFGGVLTRMASSGSVRCINVVNFIRGVEPRGPMDLMLPVQRQMETILAHRLPATWLLQYDALVEPRFVDYLKAHMAKDHEVGFWFEMNERHCRAAGVEWRGRPGYEWDHYPFVAFTIGYTPEERIKLADAAMNGFKEVWGRYPSSVASWNLDSITLAHVTTHYGIDAYAVCRDQIATDGFTIWGAPIAGYYPSKANAWSPALTKGEQIDTPIFRMLGQDPVYYYDDSFKLPSGGVVRQPDTMEPVWVSGRSPLFIDRFLAMIAESPTLDFAYAQLGQENNFGWPEMADAYPRQMAALAKLRDAGGVHVETMGDSGRRFKRTFSETPAQAQVMLDDPFGNTDPAEGSVWYQSRFYRADLHLKGDLPYLRDLTVYSDRNPQPFLRTATRDHEVDQRMPAVVDGYHWSADAGPGKAPGAGGFFVAEGKRLQISGRPKVRETGKTLLAELPVGEGRTLHLRFEERKLTARLSPEAPLTLAFEWDPTKAALAGVTPEHVAYRWQGFDYSVGVDGGKAVATTKGWSVEVQRSVELRMAQTS